MNFIFENEEITQTDIQKLIDNQVEESTHLEFKRADAFGKSEVKKKEISKDVSAFANSDGGIIIYGIAEDNHKAASLSFIDGNEYSKEWLEQTIQSNIKRTIPNLRIIPVRVENDIQKTLYVIKIPESYDAPHMAGDKKYYNRKEFQTLVMEEYEVRNSFNKRGLSKLEIFDCYINILPKPDYDDMKTIYLFTLVQNVSNYVEEKYKTVVHLKNFNSEIKLSTPRENVTDAIVSPTYAKISTLGSAPIFQNEVLTCGTIILNVPKSKYEEILNKIEIEIDLLYMSGTDAKDFLMKDIYARYTIQKGSK